MGSKEAAKQKHRCFQNIQKLIYSLTDEEWEALISYVPSTATKVQLAILCTKIVSSISGSAIKSYLPTLIPVMGMETVRKAEETLSMTPSDSSISDETPSTSATALRPRPPSSLNLSDLMCDVLEIFVGEVKAALQEELGTASSRKATSLPKDWKETCSIVVMEMLSHLPDKPKQTWAENTTGGQVNTTAATDEDRSSTPVQVFNQPSVDTSAVLADEAPVVEEQRRKRRRGFFFIFGKTAGQISLKMSRKVHPDGVLSESDSNAADHQEPSPKQLRVTPIKKMRARMARVFSNIRKALPNPFSCLSPPS